MTPPPDGSPGPARAGRSRQQGHLGDASPPRDTSAPRPPRTASGCDVDCDRLRMTAARTLESSFALVHRADLAETDALTRAVAERTIRRQRRLLVRERLVDMAQPTQHGTANASRLRAGEPRFGNVAEVVRERHGERQAISRVDRLPSARSASPFASKSRARRMTEPRSAMPSALRLACDRRARRASLRRPPLERSARRPRDGEKCRERQRRSRHRRAGRFDAATRSARNASSSASVSLPHVAASASGSHRATTAAA